MKNLVLVFKFCNSGLSITFLNFFSELNLFASHGESSPSYLNESELNDSGSELSVNNSGFEADNEHPAVNTIEGSQGIHLAKIAFINLKDYIENYLQNL